MYTIDIARWRTVVRVSGTSALALSTVIINLVRVLGTVILTRLLSPDVYGITGMIMSVFYMINMLTDIGLQAYVVRHQRSDEPEFLSSVFTIHALRGVVLAAVGILAAWPLSVLLGKPDLALPLAVSSLVFISDGLISLHQFRGLRDGRVQRFALIDLVAGISQTLAAIALAFIFRSVWAIVGSMFVASAVRVWAGYAFFPGSRFLFRPSREITADFWRFSRLIAASSALTLLTTQLDKLALARILSLDQFGTFVIASSLAGAPLAFAFNYSSAIVYPVAAAASRQGKALVDAYYGCWGRFFYLYAFGGGTLIGAAELIIRLLYDPRYLPAAGYLQILAVSTAIALAVRSVESVQVATGRPRVAIELSIARLAWLAGGGVLALAQSQPFIFVLTIGLVELPAYFLGSWRFGQLHGIRWARELSLWITIAAGVAFGTAVKAGGQLLFPQM